MTKDHRAWRFVHPDLNDNGETPGLRLTSRQNVATVSGNDAVRQSVLLLLSTRPGERLMRPSYGCNLYSLVFSPNDDTTAAMAVHYVHQALTQWEPRVNIISLDAVRDEFEPGLLVITLTYQVRTTGIIERIELSLNLAGEDA